MITKLVGIDIGGTKCAVCVGIGEGMSMRILEKRCFPTPTTFQMTMEQLIEIIEELNDGDPPIAIGVSCGGPLNSQQGLIFSPPNLPNWGHVDILTPLSERFGVPVGLQNDANAGALAEWLWGAGQGCRNLIFLTCGTGLGAGLILDSKLYVGTNEMAGEVGHIRLDTSGPIGYGKIGSFEGFCSGGGIARLARQIAAEKLQAGEIVGYCSRLSDLEDITAEAVGKAAQIGDYTALAIWDIVARRLGQGLALLVDILNPERIILGGLYTRQRALLEPLTLKVLHEEALASSLVNCQVLTAGLGEQIGDFASLAVALTRGRAT